MVMKFAALSLAALALASCQMPLPGSGQYAGSYGEPPSRSLAPLQSQVWLQMQAPPPQQAMGRIVSWRGRDADGITNNVRVTPLGGGRHAVVIAGGGNNCGMSVEGVATDVAPGRLRLTKYIENAQQTCTIDMSVAGNQMRIRKDQCSYFRGTRCGFEGTVTRTSG